MIKYLKSDDLSKFSFDHNETEATSFERVKSYGSKGAIRIAIKIFEVIAGVVYRGNSIGGKSLYFIVQDTSNGIHLVFDFSRNVLQIRKKAQRQPRALDPEDQWDLEEKIKDLKRHIDQLENDISNQEYVRSTKDLKELQEEWNILFGDGLTKEEALEYDTEIQFDPTLKGISDIERSIQFTSLDFFNLLEEDFNTLETNVKSPEFVRKEEESENRKTVFNLLSWSILNLNSKMRDFEIIFSKPNFSRPPELFHKNDKDNSFFKAIHSYSQLNSSEKDESFQFIKRWMVEFGIGSSFTITTFGNEAFVLKLINTNGEFPLSDLGSGSVQIMLLLLQLGGCIHKVKPEIKGIERHMIMEEIPDFLFIMEEPETNLHPGLQSKLADLLFEINKSYFDIQFLVETHSEYIIRRSQVLVAKKGLENASPFTVYYFPEEQEKKPYSMLYENDGTFRKNFGPGFFDEASNWTLDLLRIKRERRN